MDFGELLKGGKDLFGKAGGGDGIKEKFDKVNNSDKAVSYKSIVSMNRYVGKIEKELEANVGADDINISANTKSELGEFIQKGLQAMGHELKSADGTFDGKAGTGTVAALNLALMDKVESVGWTDMDKLKDVKEIDDITQLTGRHLQVFIDELVDRDILEGDSTELLQDLGQALRDIDNDKLQHYANKLDPKIEAPALEATPEDPAAATAPVVH